MKTTTNALWINNNVYCLFQSYIISFLLKTQFCFLLQFMRTLKDTMQRNLSTIHKKLRSTRFTNNKEICDAIQINFSIYPYNIRRKQNTLFNPTLIKKHISTPRHLVPFTYENEKKKRLCTVCERNTFKWSAAGLIVIMKGQRSNDMVTTFSMDLWMLK